MEKIWLKSYDLDVPQEINPDAFSSLVDYLEQCIDKFNDSDCFVNFGTTLSYQQIDT